MRCIAVRLARCVPVLAFLYVAGAEVRAQVVTGPTISAPRGRGRPLSAHVFFVDDSPSGCAYSTTIQEAVDAASNGDVVVVKAGTYPGFTIDGKGVNVFGEAGPSGTDVHVDRAVVRNLRRDQTLVMHGLDFLPSPTSSFFSNDAGPVWVQHCRADGLSVLGCDSVGVHDTSITQLGLYVSDSTVYAYRSSFTGSAGMDGGYFGDCNQLYGPYPCASCFGCFSGTEGGAGATISDQSKAFFFGGSLQGGTGAFDVITLCCAAGGAPDGPALLVNYLSDSTVMDATLYGVGATGTGTLTTLSGKVGAYSISTPVVSGSSALLTFGGPVGWNVFLTYSFNFQPRFVSSGSGFSVVDPASHTVFVGALPSSGSLQVSLPLSLPYLEDARIFYSQATLYDPATGTSYLAEPCATLVLRQTCP